MIKNQLKTLPNIKEKDIKEFSNQQMLAGTPPGASDPSSRPKLARIAVHSKAKRRPGRGRCVKIQRKPTKHHPNIKTTTTKQFPTKKIQPGPPRRCLARFQKISDFGKFRVWKSYFQSFPDFFQNNFSGQTRMDHVSEWYESILEEKSQAWMITQLQI